MASPSRPDSMSIAGPAGLEPTSTVLETVMLPLHYRPILPLHWQWPRMDSNHLPLFFRQVLLHSSCKAMEPAARVELATCSLLVSCSTR